MSETLKKLEGCCVGKSGTKAASWGLSPGVTGASWELLAEAHVCGGVGSKEREAHGEGRRAGGDTRALGGQSGDRNTHMQGLLLFLHSLGARATELPSVLGSNRKFNEMWQQEGQAGQEGGFRKYRTSNFKFCSVGTRETGLKKTRIVQE